MGATRLGKGHDVGTAVVVEEVAVGAAAEAGKGVLLRGGVDEGVGFKAVEDGGQGPGVDGPGGEDVDAELAQDPQGLAQVGGEGPAAWVWVRGRVVGAGQSGDERVGQWGGAGVFAEGQDAQPEWSCELVAGVAHVAGVAVGVEPVPIVAAYRWVVLGCETLTEWAAVHYGAALGIDSLFGIFGDESGAVFA